LSEESRADKPFRWGLIGAGDIATRRVAPALRDSPGSELLAVARARAQLLDAFARSVGASRTYARWQELVRDRDVDAVYVATPVYLHAEQTIAAAEAGRHVLCEKPMAMNVSECDRMIAACHANNVTLGIAYYRHFYPVVERIKHLMASGEIGEPALVQVNAFEAFNPAPDDPRYWLMRKSQAGGGPMFDFGCHRIEVLLNVFGPIGHATGMVAKVRFKREVEDTAVALLQLANGACATIAVTHASHAPRDTVDIYAARGSLHVANLNAGDLKIAGLDGDRLESHPPAANLHQPLVDEFVRAVMTGREPAVTGETGRAVAAIEDAVYRNEGSGQQVPG
jgi:predicted dehydrogenase